MTIGPGQDIGDAPQPVRDFALVRVPELVGELAALRHRRGIVRGEAGEHRCQGLDWLIVRYDDRDVRHSAQELAALFGVARERTPCVFPI